MIINNNYRIVILGAAGFIGFHLAKFFHMNSNLEIVMVDNFVNGKSDSDFQDFIKLSRVNFFNLDLSHYDSYNNLFTSNDIVLNCAALNGTQKFYSSPVQVIHNSALSSILAAEFCANAQVVSYIYFASSESYAGGVSLGYIEVPTAENVPLVIEDVRNPRWSYAASKTIGEVSTIANHMQFGLQYYILRIHNIYGPRMGFNHAIPDLITKFSLGNFQVHGPNETRAFLFINDLNSILSEIIFTDKLNKNSIYNIGSKNEITIANLAKLILHEMHIESEIEPIDSFKGSVPRRCPDTSLIRSQISYPETPLPVGIRKTLAWYKSNQK
jgi:nucleoside-diphosphate-sugar epimerase